MLRTFLLAGVALAAPSIAFAQTPDQAPASATDDSQSGAATPDDAASAQGDHVHVQEGNDIVVTGFRRTRATSSPVPRS